MGVLQLPLRLQGGAGARRGLRLGRSGLDKGTLAAAWRPAPASLSRVVARRYALTGTGAARQTAIDKGVTLACRLWTPL
jgi:hypothetical protein